MIKVKLIITHNPKVASSSLAPATKDSIVTAIKVVAIFYCLKIGCNNVLKTLYYVELGKSWGNKTPLKPFKYQQNPQKNFIAWKGK